MSAARRVPIAVLLACAVGVAACGSSKSPTATNSSPAATQASTSASQPAPAGGPGKAAATRVAKKINLHRADLPGATSAPNPVTTGALDTQLATCSGSLPPSAAIVNVNSPSFTLSTAASRQAFTSNVMVLPTAADVTRDLTAIRSAKAQSCIRTLVPKALAGAGNSQVKFGAVEITTLPAATPPGADGTFGYRLTIAATAAGQQLKLILDEFGISVGRIEVSLSDFESGQPVPAATEQHLFSVLAARAVAHRL